MTVLGKLRYWLGHSKPGDTFTVGPDDIENLNSVDETTSEEFNDYIQSIHDVSVTWVLSNDARSYIFTRIDQIAVDKAAAPGLVTPSDSPERMLKFFAFEHLPPHLQAVSGEFFGLAHTIVALVPASAERTVALRKLLEAKDAAVRATVYPGH